MQITLPEKYFLNDNIYDVILYDIEMMFQILVHLAILKYRDDQVTFEFWI